MWSIRRFIGQPCTHHYLVLGELSPKPVFTIQRYDITESAMQTGSITRTNGGRICNETEIDHINLPLNVTHMTVSMGRVSTSMRVWMRKVMRSGTNTSTSRLKGGVKVDVQYTIEGGKVLRYR